MSNCNTTNESDMDNLSLLEQMGEFELVPSDTVYDFEDKFRFTKLSLSEAQNMQRERPAATAEGGVLAVDEHAL